MQIAVVTGSDCAGQGRVGEDGLAPQSRAAGSRMSSSALCQAGAVFMAGAMRSLSYLVWNSSPSPHPGRAEKLGGS